jgi:hypothetical protein
MKTPRHQHQRSSHLWVGRGSRQGETLRGQAAQFAALLATGLSVREIAEETGATKSSVHRMKQRIERETKEREAEEEGRLGEGG